MEVSSVTISSNRKGDNRRTAELGDDTWNLSSELMVQEFGTGRELTVSVMGDRALGVTEITTDLLFYDYEAKYAPGGSRHVIPAQISQKATDQVMDLPIDSHTPLRCRGVTRTDFC